MSFSPSKLHQRKSKSRSPQKVSSTSNNNATLTSGSEDLLPQPATTHHLVNPLVLPHIRRGQGTHGLVNYIPESLVVLPNRCLFTHVSTSLHHHHNTQQNTGLPTFSDHDHNLNEPHEDSLPPPDDPFADDSLNVFDRTRQFYITRHESETPEMREQRLQRRHRKRE